MNQNQNKKHQNKTGNKNMNKQVRVMTKQMAEMKARMDEMIRQRVTETEEQTKQPKDASLMTQQEFFDSIDALVEAQGFNYDEPKEEASRQTYITNEYTTLPFAMFCSELYINVTANVVNNFGKITLPDFVTYCCSALQLMLTANPEIIGHDGVTAEECAYASQRLEDMMLPDAVYFALQSYKPFITEDGRTKVIFSPYRWNTTAGVAIPPQGPVPTHQAAIAHIPGGNRDVSDIQLADPVYSILTDTGDIIVQDHPSHGHCIRHDQISSYMINILPIPQQQAGSTGLTANILNTWIGVDAFDRPLHNSIYMAGYRGQVIQNPVSWVSVFVTIGEAIQMMNQFNHMIKNPGKGTFQRATVKKCPGHIVQENGRISFITQGPREKFVPVFVIDTFAHENAFKVEIAQHQIRGADIYENIIKRSYIDQREISTSWFNLGHCYRMLVKGTAGDLKQFMKTRFA